MEVILDSAGRLHLPKRLRDALGLKPGSTVDVTMCGRGLHIEPDWRTATIGRDDCGRLVAHSDMPVTDEMVFALIDRGRL